MFVGLTQVARRPTVPKDRVRVRVGVSDPLGDSERQGPVKYRIYDILMYAAIVNVAHKIQLTERTYYALMHANQGFLCTKRGQIDIKVGRPD